MSWYRRGASRAGMYQAMAAAAALLLAGSLSACSAGTPGGPRPAPAVSEQPARDPAVTAVPHRVRVTNQADRVFRARATRWPRSASGAVALRAPAAGHAAGPASPIAGTPLWAQAVAGGGHAGAGEGAYHGPSRVSASVLPHARAAALGVSAVVFEVSGQGTTGQVRVGLDYASFGQAYGGNYGSRLRLVALPACSLTTPQVAACRRQTPLTSVQDYRASSVSAVVDLGAAQTASLMSYTPGRPDAALLSSGAQVIGATDSTGQEGGQGGTYAAAKLSPSGTWAEGGGAGAFTYSYPITLPSASTQLVPSVSLGYDSQEVNGKTATAQAQSSWLGDGWQTPDSFIALSTIPCDDNPEGSASPQATTDECYDGQIAEMSLDGTGTPLVFGSSSTTGGVTTSQWRAQDDNDAVITHVSAASTVFGKYSLGSDYWTVTERDGTRYYFGRQHLPGWASGDPATDSADTMPVYSAHSGDPCYSSSGFASSVCTMAYEWHLDYVTDTHSEAMAYYYTQTTNYYGRDQGASDVPYVSDSYLSEIDYGFLDGQAYGTVPDKAVFTAAPRCVASTCGALSSSNPDVATQYPDIPVDLLCASGTACTAYAPSMFSEVRLTSITTEQYGTAAGAYQDIDTYAFTQTEPASGDGLSPTCG